MYLQTKAVISIHAPSRERHRHRPRHGICGTISIHAPSRERHLFQSGYNLDPTHFNPRSLTGATFVQNLLLAKMGISIHAPSRERLWCSRSYGPFLRISIHAPSPTRERNCISIHAPSRERLGVVVNYFLIFFYFNPRSLTGATTFRERHTF